MKILYLHLRPRGKKLLILLAMVCRSPVKGDVTQEISNTMEEDMPARSRRFKTAEEPPLFEKASLDGVMESAFKLVNNN